MRHAYYLSVLNLFLYRSTQPKQTKHASRMYGNKGSKCVLVNMYHTNIYLWFRIQIKTFKNINVKEKFKCSYLYRKVSKTNLLQCHRIFSVSCITPISYNKYFVWATNSTISIAIKSTKIVSAAKLNTSAMWDQVRTFVTFVWYEKVNRLNIVRSYGKNPTAHFLQ